MYVHICGQYCFMNLKIPILIIDKDIPNKLVPTFGNFCNSKRGTQNSQPPPQLNRFLFFLGSESATENPHYG